MSDDVTYIAAFQGAVAQEMERDDTIFVLGTDMYERGGAFAQFKGIGPRFGRDRVRDMPIAEAGMVAAGVGAAMTGMRPIVDLSFVDFGLGAMDEIINQAAKIRYMLGVSVPMMIRASSGVALYGAQHSNQPEAWFAQTPGLVVATPATPADVAGLARTCLRGDDPVVFLMHKKLANVRGPSTDDAIPFGKAAVARAGSTVTVVSYSYMTQLCLQAAADLGERENIEVEVIDLWTVYPLDVATLVESVEKTGLALVVTDSPSFAGIAAEVSAAIQEHAFHYLDAPVARLGGLHAPIPNAPVLIDALIPNVRTIQQAVRDLVGAPIA